MTNMFILFELYKIDMPSTPQNIESKDFIRTIFKNKDLAWVVQGSLDLSTARCWRLITGYFYFNNLREVVAEGAEVYLLWRV